jgi:lipopolysaccharide transport system permease protein
MFVGKTVFPAEVLILVPVLSGAVNFALALPILLIADVALHQRVGPSIVLLPVLIAGQVLLTTGLLFFFSTLNVFYRDFGQLETYLVLMLLYLTPIFYQVQSIPEPYRNIILASPIAELIISYHDILFFGRFPPLSSLAYVFAVGILLCAVGYAFFNRFRELFGELL